MNFFKCLLACLITVCAVPVSDRPSPTQALSQTPPVFALYSEENVIKSGIMHFDLTDGDLLSQSKAETSGEYVVAADNKPIEFSLPFISDALDIAPMSVTVNGDKIDGEIWYGEHFNGRFDNSRVYPPRLDEDLSGTLYTIYPSGNNLKVTLDIDDSQQYIYEASKQFVSFNENGLTVLNLSETNIGRGYKIFITGEYAVGALHTEAEYESESITCKTFVDTLYAEFADIYEATGKPPVEFFYSQMNRFLRHARRCSVAEMFFDSYSGIRTNAYKFCVLIDGEAVIKCNSRTGIIRDSSFSPPVFIFKCNKADYPISYYAKLNEQFPYIVASSVPMQSSNGVYYTQTADDFFVAYSSAEKPVNRSTDKENKTPKIILIVICCLTVMLLTVFSVLFIWSKKNRYG